MASETESQPQPRKSKLFAVLFFVVIALVVVGAFTLLQRKSQYAALAKETEALAMIIGMVPMAIGLGEGGEQNAPLGRAVIGGLLFATFATLFFVPCVFSIIHTRLERRRQRALA